MYTKANHIIDDNELRNVAPSVFATQPHYKVSERYDFIPTINVVDRLRKEGWLVVDAKEQNVRTEDRATFAKHELRFTKEEFINQQLACVGQVRPEVVLLNSHDLSAAYVISAGLMRLACLNGLVVADCQFGSVHVRHINLDVREVIKATYKLVDAIPSIMDVVKDWQATELSPGQRMALAVGGHALRWEDKDTAPIAAPQLLDPIRYGDAEPNLWTTFNLIQEHLLKGGQYDRSRRNENGRRRGRARMVNGIDEGVKLNKGLWQLAQMLKEGSLNPELN